MNGCPPNQSSFTSALNLSSGLEALDKAKELLAMVIVRSLDSDVFVGNSLVVLYTVWGILMMLGLLFIMSVRKMLSRGTPLLWMCTA
ncbi:hypothetical protein Goshw_029807 [Gossypium schwendimanii]|uniref:Uncharacterized protein n=1 Tax=Gossypium schwendimanii TaxID=34291 RepID=A0A7J9LIW1_GOSSC|nr:hypothetical protein [Gossypium schwendimanii]